MYRVWKNKMHSVPETIGTAKNFALALSIAIQYCHVTEETEIKRVAPGFVRVGEGMFSAVYVEDMDK